MTLDPICGSELSEITPGTASIDAMIITMLCTVVGGAILAIPASLHYASLFNGIFMILFVGMLSTLSAKKLCILSEKLGSDSYVHIFSTILSPNSASHGGSLLEKSDSHRKNINFMKILIQIVVFWYTFGIAVSFIVIIGDSMKPLSTSWLGFQGFYSTEKFWILLVSPILFLASSVQQITELKIFSLISFLTMIYVSIVVGIRYFEAVSCSSSIIPGEGVDIISLKKDIFQSFPVLTVAYTMHYNVPQLYFEMKDKTVRKLNYALYITMAVVVILYLQTGIMGYLHFGAKSIQSGGDILALYSKDDSLVNIGRFLMFFHFALGFPMVSIACRQTLMLFIVGKEKGTSTLWRLVATFAVVSAACTLAAYSSGITQVFVFNGVLFGIHIVMTIPALLYFINFRKNMGQIDMCSTVLLGFCGISFSVVGFAVVLANTLK